MAIALTQHFLDELKKNVNAQNVIVEIALDSGAKKFGYATGRIAPLNVDYLHDGTYNFDGSISYSGSGDVNGVEGFTDVIPCLKSVSSLQNKIDLKGFSTRGEMTVVISGRDNFKAMVANEYLKNRRVTVRQGFIAPGFSYADYAPTFTGRIRDWSRKGDELTLSVADDLMAAAFNKKLPSEASTTDGEAVKYVVFSARNPLDIMTDILTTNPDLLNINSAYVDTAQFTSEKALWFAGWSFNRVLIEPKSVNDILNELQIETNATLIHDGEKITVKAFAPSPPYTAVEEYTDNANILDGSFSIKSGYKDQFFNRAVVCFDYDESNQDEYTNYQNIVIYADAASQDPTQWDEASTKVIKSKWLRSYSWSQPVNITGVKIFHTSTSNGVGNGTLVYTAATKSLTWQANGDSVGPAVKLDKAGKYQLFSANANKSIRVLLYDAALLPGGNQTDTITLANAPAVTCANYLGQKLLNRFRDPAAIVSFSVDINNSAYNSIFIKPTDLKDITTDEAFEKGASSWNQERVMLTSMRMDFSAGKIDIEAIEAKFYKRIGYIAPAGYPDYPSATPMQRRWAFIGRASDNKVYDGAAYVAGSYIW